jgi:hypothetical protein
MDPAHAHFARDAAAATHSNLQVVQFKHQRASVVAVTSLH